jgi:hypothetical protein
MDFIRPVEWNNFMERKDICYINIMGKEMGGLLFRAEE